jgi:hypothetical protein
MTERSSDESDPPRLDLRALDAAPDADRTGAIVIEVMARIAASRVMRADIVPRLLRVRSWTAAAVLAVIATATVAATPRRSSASVDTDMIAGWADASHVPTNGELLAVYHGYRP